MHDNTFHIPASRVITTLFWSATAMLLAAAWITHFLADWKIAQLLGYCACVMSAASAVSHVRCYVLRAVRIIVSSLPESAVEDSVRSLRR